MAAGQVGACLNTMAILPSHQADLLRELDKGGGVGPDSIKKLCQATDLCLHAIKEMAHAICHSMSALVATERHLWLNLSGIKTFLLDAPLSPPGHFGEAVSSVVERLQQTKRQSAVFIPRCSQARGLPAINIRFLALSTAKGECCISKRGMPFVTSRCCHYPYKAVGVETKLQEKYAIPSSEDNFA